MDLLKRKISFLIISVILYINVNRICAQNSTIIYPSSAIPIISTNILGPKRFERIIVPVEYPPERPSKNCNDHNGVNSEEGSKRFQRIIVPVEYPPIKGSKNCNNNNGDKNVHNQNEPEHKIVITYNNNNSNKNDDGDEEDNHSFSYVTRTDGHSEHENPKTLIPTDTSPNDIQPLHINPKVFKKSPPHHTKESEYDKKRRSKDREERLRIESLPENPYLVPRTEWYDNLGKYNYGIIHDASRSSEEKTNNINNHHHHHDAAENESKETAAPHIEAPIQNQVQVVHEEDVAPVKFITKTHHEPSSPPVIQSNIHQEPILPVTPKIIHHEQLSPVQFKTQTHHEPSPSPVKFKSSFRDPNQHAPFHHQNNNNGRFLYKTEVYYPNYRDHLYLPVPTYYGKAHELAKTFPVINTIHHPPPPSQTNHHHHHHKDENESDEVHTTELPVKKEPSLRKIHPTVSPRKTPHISHKKEPPKKEIEEKKPQPPPKKEEPEEEIEDYDYEEGDSDDEEDDGESSDKYTEDEEEEDEEPKSTYYKYSDSGSFKAPASDEEDEFDKAWKKYGYAHQSSDEDSYESSESQIVPQRKKIVHMKMEYYTRPHNGNNNNNNNEVVVAASNMDEEISKATEKVNTGKNKKKRKNKNKNKNKKRRPNIVVESQKPHPNAGPDDLKFFQYLSFINNEHRAGGRVGNDKHYIEQHERGNHDTGAFQKKVKWADKDGGFGEHYWDLNHG